MTPLAGSTRRVHPSELGRMIVKPAAGSARAASPIVAADERAYFDSERAVANDPNHPYHLLPSFPAGVRVLDVGCGGSWDWRAQGIGSYIGIDIRQSAIAYCLEHDAEGEYFVGNGERLTMIGEAEVDRVMSKVAVPYMRISAFAAEAHRVLKPGGELWVSYHDVRYVLNRLKVSWAQRKLANIIYQSYVMVNGIVLHLSGWQFRYPIRARMESFQTRRALRRALRNAGFTDVAFWASSANSEQRVVTARRR